MRIPHLLAAAAVLAAVSPYAALGQVDSIDIASPGAWSYTAGSALNNLAAGQTVSDTFTVAAADGTTSTVQVSITGTNDAAVLSSATAALTETDAVLSTSGDRKSVV